MTGLLLDGEIEFYLGLASPSRQSPRIRHRLFASFSPKLFVRRDHPLLIQNEVTTDDLLSFPLISGTAWNEALLQLGENEDRYLFATTIQIDNYSILAEIAAETDAVMVSSVLQAKEGLVELKADTNLTQLSTNYYVFSIAGLPMSSAAESMLLDLQTRSDELFGMPTDPAQDVPHSELA